ncbi:MAG TPA: S8 family serine peptidase [Armatimonadota bacterium]|jgi:subtilisin family serine protease
MARRSALLYLPLLASLALPSSAHALVVVPDPTPDPTEPPAISTHLPGEPTVAGTPIPGRVLVGMQWGHSVSELTAAGETVSKEILNLGVAVVAVPVGTENAALKRLGALPGVEYAEKDRQVVALRIPSDTYYGSNQWNLTLDGAPNAWDITTGGTGVTIAIVDTGIDSTHPDLSGKVLSGYNATTGTTGIPTDTDGHGTHVSGIAAATGDNGTGIAGVSWGARILPVKVLGRNGVGSDSDVADGVQWAADHGANIINMSLGDSAYSSTSDRAVQYAWNQGCLIVAAAGNDYQNGNPTSYPAALSHVIGVGALNDSGLRASYSNTGSYVSVTAPGGDPSSNQDNNKRHWIFSTWPRSLGSSYAMLAGTSQATPQVSGLAALIWSENPSLTNAQVRDAIQSTAVPPTGVSGKTNSYGYGRVDFGKALLSVSQQSTVQAPSLILTSPASLAVVGGTISIMGTVEGDSLASFEVQYGVGSSPSTWTTLGTAQTSPVTAGKLADWQTQNTGDGRYTLRILAADTSGQQSASALVAVDIDNTLPTVTLSSPVANSFQSGMVAVTGTVSDSHPGTVRVEWGTGSDPTTWYAVPNAIWPAGSDQPLAQWDTTGLNGGVYSLRVIATDQAGNTRQVTSTFKLNLVPGDLNGDGKTTIVDAILALRAAAGILTPTEQQIAAGDLAPSPTPDGRLDISDVLKILLLVLGEGV